jgi:phosphate-selective porin OprO and OprP
VNLNLKEPNVRFSSPFKTCLALTCISAIAVTASAQDLKTKWSKALRYTSEDKAFDLKVGGRIHNDWAWMSADRTLTSATKAAATDPTKDVFEDGNEFRRARLYISGTLYKSMFFKAQFDFEDGMADFKDVFMGIKTPAGSIKAGQFKEPIGLEELTSSNNVTFMERSLRNSLSPARSTGFQLNDTAGAEQRVYWAFGGFRDSDAFGDSKGDGEYSFTGRVSGLPVFKDGGKQLIHAGVGVSYRSPNDNAISFKDNREVHLAPNLAKAKIPSNGVLLVNVEAAWVSGPFSLQGEYTIVNIKATTPGASDPSFSGAYVQAAYTLTGESRSYKKSAGAFGSIAPANNYDSDTGDGAWEVAIRYSMLDMNDAGVMGGKLTGITAGVNWYLNPNARIMFNLNRTDLDTVGQQDAASVRFQVNF